MPVSDYIANLRTRIGHGLLMLPGVCAIIVRDGRVLLQRRADTGEWGTVGGAVDPGETPAVAVLREAKEETGLAIAIDRVAGVYSSPEIVYPNRDRCIYVTTSFRCRVVGGTLEAVDGESAELRWFDPADLPPLHGDANVRVHDALPEHGEAKW
ncbi:MAG: NUDIX domain-containing protein [Planctomycetota bacterium]